MSDSNLGEYRVEPEEFDEDGNPVSWTHEFKTGYTSPESLEMDADIANAIQEQIWEQLKRKVFSSFIDRDGNFPEEGILNGVVIEGDYTVVEVDVELGQLPPGDDEEQQEQQDEAR